MYLWKEKQYQNHVLHMSFDANNWESMITRYIAPYFEATDSSANSHYVKCKWKYVSVYMCVG